MGRGHSLDPVGQDRQVRSLPVVTSVGSLGIGSAESRYAQIAEHSSLAFKVGPFVAQIRALRDLAATTRLVTEFSIQNDALDLDGPKFTYVLGRIIGIFAESARESNCGPLYCQTIMALFAKKIGEAEARSSQERA